MKLRIATFNLENLDDKPGESPSLQERIQVLRPQLLRLHADVICFQEVNGQETPNQPRQLLALKSLLEQTEYANFHIAHTKTQNGEAYDERNLVVISRYPLSGVEQYLNRLIPTLQYKKVTSLPPETNARPVGWERPILYARVNLSDGQTIHLINVHLKSRLPSEIKGQSEGKYAWKTSSGWAEGFFLSSMKRVGQALEARILVDSLFDNDAGANIIVCGDFNAHPDEVPVEAIAGRVENTGNAALIRRTMISCESTIPEPARYTYVHQGQKRLLDHMLISPTMLKYYRTSEIHNETLHDEGVAFAYDTKFPESDHAPFVAEFVMEA